jgi:thiol-disulfide isomerase/thioredoxin
MRNASTINIKAAICVTVLLGSMLFSNLKVNGQDIRAVKITDLEKIISESRRPMVINFWATWCRPCIEEIPWFQQVVKDFEKDSVQLILVSVDYKEEYPAGIQATAGKRGFTAPIVWLNETNADYFCPKIDPHWSGAVPATLIINNKTGSRLFFEEQLGKEKLKEQVKAILKTLK